MSEPSIVVAALLREYIVVQGRIEGATQRLTHARKQVQIEGDIIRSNLYDLGLLKDAILSAGGHIPEDKPDEEAS